MDGNFIDTIKKVKNKRIHTIKNSLHQNEYHKFYTKNKPKDIKYILTRNQYFNIIKNVNTILSNRISEGKDVKLPSNMGSITLFKYNSTFNIVDGKVKTNLPIDWHTTLKLWQTDIDAFNSKLLIRREEKEIFKIKYNKKRALFKNKIFYKLYFNRNLKLKLKNNIQEGIVDAFIL